MRKIAGIFGVAGLLLSVAAVGLPPIHPPKKTRSPTTPRTASQLAEDIFTKADKHKHGFLTKIEFKKADTELMPAIKQMAIDGTIGKGKPSRPDAKSITSAFTEGFADADTDHDKKVTLAEFTDYVSRAVGRSRSGIESPGIGQRPRKWWRRTAAATAADI